MPTVESNLQPTDVTPPVRITIAGEFWDSQIYAGKLSLFTSDRRFLQMDWKSFVSQLPITPELKVAAEIAFLGNRQLYDPGARVLLRDPEIRKLLVQKFTKLAALHHAWPERRLRWLSERDNRFPFPHNDSDIHYDTMYVGSSMGVHSLKQDLRNPAQCSDVPALNLAVKLHTVAYAAGSQGLYQVADAEKAKGSENQISEQPCVRCEWTYSSIIASGPNNAIYVAEFDRSRRRQAGREDAKMTRQLERIITADELFERSSHNGSGLTWGARNRLFRFMNGEIEVVSCKSHSKTPTQKKGLHFQRRGKFPAAEQMTSAGVISARVAPFGSVIELHDGLLVIPTKGETMFFPGEPTNWRIFPRSTDYLNHLHVVYEDRLDVIAFTHDYFVSDQSSKMVGFSVGSDDADNS